MIENYENYKLRKLTKKSMRGTQECIFTQYSPKKCRAMTKFYFSLWKVTQFSPSYFNENNFVK